MSAPLIYLRNLGYVSKDSASHEKKILYDINLTLSKRHVTTLIGPNGAGKTTLLKIILGLIAPTTGEIIRRKPFTVGYMPQKIHFNGFLPLRVTDFLRLFSKSPSSIDDYLSQFNAQKLALTPMHLLSGGELQKILFIQATLNTPDLLILDEPSQGLDIVTQDELYASIDQVRHKTGCGVLLVSHDLHMVMAKSDSVFCLNHHICCSGHPEDVQKHPEYLGLFKSTLLSNVAPYHHHHDHVHKD